jgi:hypothetical protein
MPQGTRNIVLFIAVLAASAIMIGGQLIIMWEQKHAAPFDWQRFKRESLQH